MARDPKLFIHVGYGRTATSWLQQEVFPDVESVHFLGKSDGDFPRWMIDWSYLDDPEFARRADDLRAELVEACQDDRPNLVSSEAFTRGGSEISRQASRIAEIAPEAEVIIVLRDPIDLLGSAYRYCVENEGFYRPFEDCLDWERTPMVFFKRRPFHLPDYFYDEAVEAFRAALAPERVHVLRYEELANDPMTFFARLGRIMGCTFDADFIGERLARRVNASPNDERLRKLRCENLSRELGLAAEDLGITARVELIDAEESNEVMDDDLRHSLRKHFANRTFGYY